MTSPTCLCFNALALTAAITIVSDRAPVAPASAPFVVNDNGAWSWFEDERAVIDAANCTLLVSSVANGSGTGGTSRHGSVEIVVYDLMSGLARRSTLSANFEGDDHDSAALYVRPDGRYVAMFSRHNTDTMSRWRISTEPGDASAWTSVGAFDNGAGTTYSNLYEIPAENGGEGPPLPRLRRPRVDLVARRATAQRARPTVRALRRQQQRQHPPDHHRATSPRLCQQHLPRRHPTRPTAAL
jgi:hypothetical protein